MADDQALRDIARYLNDATKRERAADERNKAIVDAITRGFDTLTKELHEGITKIEHLWLDQLNRR